MPMVAGREITDAELQVIYDKRPFHGYDVKKGTRVGFTSLIDLHQAIAMGHVQMHKPGEQPNPSANPMRNYAALASEEITNLCAHRNVPRYMTLTRDEMCSALLELDKADDERLNAAPVKKGK